MVTFRLTRGFFAMEVNNCAASGYLAALTAAVARTTMTLRRLTRSTSPRSQPLPKHRVTLLQVTVRERPGLSPPQDGEDDSIPSRVADVSAFPAGAEALLNVASGDCAGASKIVALESE